MDRGHNRPAPHDEAKTGQEEGMEPYKSWEQLTPDEKNGWLRHNLCRFIEHTNEQGIVRNLAVDVLKARLERVEAELKRMAARMARLER